MATETFRSAMLGNQSSNEDIQQRRDEFHDRLRGSYAGKECGDLGIEFQLCLFDTQHECSTSSSSSSAEKKPFSGSAFFKCKNPQMLAYQECLKNMKKKPQPRLGGKILTDKQVEDRKVRVQRLIDERKEAGIEITKEEFLKMSDEIQKDDTRLILKQNTKSKGTKLLEESLKKADEEADGVKKPWWRAIF